MKWKPLEHMSIWAVPLAVSVLAVGMVAGILASPWLIGWVVGGPRDWAGLSDVGQAYGGISAILSGLALCGIAGSLLLHHRQTRLAHATAMRERHFELVKIGLDDPRLRPPGVADAPDGMSRQWAYLNLWVNYWAMLWGTGAFSDIKLRAALESLFRDDDAYDWWATTGPLWSTHASGRTRRFEEIANAAHRQAHATRTSRATPTEGAPSGPEAERAASAGDDPV